MTLEQIKQTILDKKSQITNLQKEIEHYKTLATCLAPFKIGDKVKVTGYNDKETICYVTAVFFRDYYKDGFDYKFGKPKKDGSFGEQGAGIYNFKKIEKIA